MTYSGANRISFDALKKLQGSIVATSTWHTIDQSLIDRFADITGDNYFIHVDEQRAKSEGPYGGTIAHGMLVLSLLSDMAARSLPALEDLASAVNYGFDKIRFIAPVPSGSRVRAHFTLVDAVPRAATQILVRYRVTVEIEGQSRSALGADWLSLIFVKTRDEHEKRRDASATQCASEVSASQPATPHSDNQTCTNDPKHS